MSRVRIMRKLCLESCSGYTCVCVCFFSFGSGVGGDVIRYPAEACQNTLQLQNILQVIAVFRVRRESLEYLFWQARRLL